MVTAKLWHSFLKQWYSAHHWLYYHTQLSYSFHCKLMHASLRVGSPNAFIVLALLALFASLFSLFFFIFSPLKSAFPSNPWQLLTGQKHNAEFKWTTEEFPMTRYSRKKRKDRLWMKRPVWPVPRRPFTASGPELFLDTWKQATANAKLTMIDEQTFECVNDPSHTWGDATGATMTSQCFSLFHRTTRAIIKWLFLFCFSSENNSKQQRISQQHSPMIHCWMIQRYEQSLVSKIQLPIIKLPHSE